MAEHINIIVNEKHIIVLKSQQENKGVPTCAE